MGSLPAPELQADTTARMSSCTTQAVILAAGRGSRMLPRDATSLDPAQLAAADVGAKGLVPVAGHALLEYVISALADAGIAEVTIVVPARNSAVRDFFEANVRPGRVSINFATQVEANGTADALLAARDNMRDAPFLVVNSDNYYPPRACCAAAAICGNGLVAFDADALTQFSAIPREKLLRFALLEINSDDTLRAIHEKPDTRALRSIAPPLWVSMNLWSFLPDIFDHCAAVTPSPRGELELQDAVKGAMRAGSTFAVRREAVGVPDLTARADVAVLQKLLAGIKPIL